MTTADRIQANLIALGFTNTSATAIYNKIAQSVGQIVDNTVTEINNSESIITNLLISQYGYGKPLYYVQNALNFQYGDNLIINTAINPVTGAPYLNLIYAVIDTTKQIISQAAFQSTDTGGNSTLLFLKVATLDQTTKLLVKLTDVQLAAFEAYMLNFELPGLPLNIISQDANILGFNALCTYYTSYDLTTLESGIATVLNTFRDTFQFNGEFFAGDLQDYIKQNVPGVRDFFINSTTLDGIAFSGSSTMGSGYFDYVVNIVDNISYTGTIA